MTLETFKRYTFDERDVKDHLLKEGNYTQDYRHERSGSVLRNWEVVGQISFRRLAILIEIFRSCHQSF